MKPRLQSKHLLERLELKVGRRKFNVDTVASDLGETPRRVRSAIDALRRARGRTAATSLGGGWFVLRQPRMSAAARR